MKTLQVTFFRLARHHTLFKNLLKTILLVLASLWVPFATNTLADVTYTYDGAGQLETATDWQGNQAIYYYDFVGNLISAQSAITPEQTYIWLLTPYQGQVGSQVTILGTGFSTNTQFDIVQFQNGTWATVTSATTTQLVITVPSGANSGPIMVTDLNGQATSPSSFTVQ